MWVIGGSSCLSIGHRCSTSTLVIYITSSPDCQFIGIESCNLLPSRITHCCVLLWFITKDLYLCPPGFATLLNKQPKQNGHKATLLWRHNEPDGVSNHQPHDCLLNRLFGHRSKKTSKLHVTGLCAGNSPETGEFPAQMASNAENVSTWWRHHELHEYFIRYYLSYLGPSLGRDLSLRSSRSDCAHET